MKSKQRINKHDFCYKEVGVSNHEREPPSQTNSRKKLPDLNFS